MSWWEIFLAALTGGFIGSTMGVVSSYLALRQFVVWQEGQIARRAMREPTPDA